MKIPFPISLKREDFLEATPSLRSTWTFKLSSASIITNFIVTLPLFLFFWRHFPPQVPLWYSKPWGNERLVPPLFLLIPVAVSALIYGMNIFVANKFATDHPMFARVLFLTSALISIISMIIVVRVIMLVR